MKLIYDIAVMAQLVAACESANVEIVKAEQLVQQVRSHSDWTCKEKSVIDELMQDCKTLVQRMREDQSSFLRVLKEIEGELNDTENSVSNLFSGVESILGKVLAIPVAQTVAIGGGLIGAGGVISGIGAKIGGGLVNIVDGITESIHPGTIGTGWAGELLDKMKEIGEDILDTDVIWHGPGVIGGAVSGIMDHVISSGIGNGITDQWHEAWKNNPNVHDFVQDNGPMPSRMTEWYQEQIKQSWEQAGGGMVDVIEKGVMTTTNIASEVAQTIGDGFINDIKDSFTDFYETAEQIAKISGTTAYPHGQIHPEITDVLKDVVGNIGEVVTPVVTPIVAPVTGAVSGVWAQVQDSALGDAVQDALRNITENIAICRMSDLKL